MEEKELEKPIDVPIKATTSHLANKRIIIIFACASVLIVVVLLVSYFFIKNRPDISSSTTSNSQDTIIKHAIYFEPGENIGAGIGIQQTVKVFIDVQDKPINRAVIALAYDPKAISNMAIEQYKDPTSALSNAFESSELYADANKGILSLTLKMPSSTPTQKGKGQVATLTFTRKTGNATIINTTANSGFSTTNPSGSIAASSTNLTLGSIVQK